MTAIRFMEGGAAPRAVLARLGGALALAFLCFMVLGAVVSVPAMAADLSECEDGGAGQEALTKANAAAIAGAVAIGVGTFDKAVEADNKNNTQNVRGDIKETYCLKIIIYDFYESILDLLKSLKDLLIKAIKSLILSLLKKVCDFVATAINNVLNSVCLPIPSLSFTLNLPSMSKVTCDGLSLASLINVSSGTGTSVAVGTSSELNLSYPNVSNIYRNISRGTNPLTGEPIF